MSCFLIFLILMNACHHFVRNSRRHLPLVFRCVILSRNHCHHFGRNGCWGNDLSWCCQHHLVLATAHLPAQAWGKLSSCTPCTLCALTNLPVSPWSQVFPSLAFIPLPNMGNLCFINYYTYSLVSITQHWDSPTTSRKPLWFGDRKPLW